MQFREAKDQRQTNPNAGRVDKVVLSPLNRSKTAVRNSRGTPGPASSTVTRTPVPCGAVRTQTGVPGGVWLMALASNSWMIRSTLLTSKRTVAEVPKTVGHLPGARHRAAARWTSVAMSTG
jgi:hypothetical protein